MLRIRRTETVSHKQIQNMAANLRAKFSRNANIQTITSAGTDFWINNDAGFSGWLDSWKDLQVVYSELIKRRSYEKQ